MYVDANFTNDTEDLFSKYKELSISKSAIYTYEWSDIIFSTATSASRSTPSFEKFSLYRLSSLPATDLALNKVAKVTMFARGSGGCIRGEVTVSWGGDDGPTYSGKISGEVHDDYGSIEVSIRQDDDGQITVGAAGEYNIEQDQKE